MMFNATNNTDGSSRISQRQLIEVAAIAGVLGAALLLFFFSIFRCLQQKQDNEAQNRRLQQAMNQQNLLTDYNQRNLIP